MSGSAMLPLSKTKIDAPRLMASNTGKQNTRLHHALKRGTVAGNAIGEGWSVAIEDVSFRTIYAIA